MAAVAMDLERGGWRRQEQGGVVAFSGGEEAMLMMLPPKTLTGPLRDTDEKARESYMGGGLEQAGPVQETAGGLSSEYVLREANGSQTYRASFALEREERMMAYLYATNDEAAFQKHGVGALAYFAAQRTGMASTGSVVGEWNELVMTDDKGAATTYRRK